MTSLTVTARCNTPGCTWQPDGDPDKAAQTHTRKTGHTTVTETVNTALRTCYCGTTATVMPGVFPHPDCDGSVPA